jgi:hypothetical protein
MRTLDRDLKERQPLERVVPYSAQAFRCLSIEWLVATDQVCFSHAIMVPTLLRSCVADPKLPTSYVHSYA